MPGPSRVTGPGTAATPDGRPEKGNPLLKGLLIVLVVLAILYVASMLLKRR